MVVAWEVVYVVVLAVDEVVAGAMEVSEEEGTSALLLSSIGSSVTAPVEVSEEDSSSDASSTSPAIGTFKISAGMKLKASAGFSSVEFVV